MRASLRRGAHHLRGWLGDGSIPVRDEWGGRLRVAPAGYEDLRYWLRYEALTAALVRRVLQPGWEILDVGAHHGVFAICCAPSLPSRLVLMEPSPEAWPLLLANARAQRGPAWEMEEKAAGEAPGRLQLYRGMIHMLVAGPGLHPGTAGEPVEVAVTSLDSLCRERTLRPDLIKLDVEGFEAEALAGATATLAQGPRLILEWHCAMLRQRGLDPLAALAPLVAAGYRCTPYEYPEQGAVAVEALGRLPAQDIYRLYCEPGSSAS